MRAIVMTAGLLGLIVSSAHAETSFLGTALQDVNLTGQNGAIQTTSTSTVITGQTGALAVTSTNTILGAGANQIGTVSGSTVTVYFGTAGTLTTVVATGTITAWQGGSYTVTPGTGAWNMTGSTVGIAGKGGTVISTSAMSNGEAALNVLNQGAPNLNGRFMVYTSSNAMDGSNPLTLAGLGKSVDLQAVTGSCTWTINGGEAILVTKNTGESYDFAYTLVNPSITLTTKDSNATCKARIVGAN